MAHRAGLGWAGLAGPPGLGWLGWAGWAGQAWLVNQKLIILTILSLFFGRKTPKKDDSMVKMEGFCEKVSKTIWFLYVLISKTSKTHCF